MRMLHTMLRVGDLDKSIKFYVDKNEQANGASPSVGWDGGWGGDAVLSVLSTTHAALGRRPLLQVSRSGP